MVPTPSERQRIQFAYNAYLDSLVGVTFNYLIKNPHFPSRVGKHKGIDAMTAFWKPFAYQEEGVLSEEQLRAIAIESVEMLTRQIDLICAAFGLENPQAKAPDNLKQAIRQAMSETIDTLLAQPKPLGADQDLVADEFNGDRVELGGVDFDEDSLLGNLLDDATIAA